MKDPHNVMIVVGFRKNVFFSCSAYGGPTSFSNPATHPLVFTWTGPDGVNTNNQEIMIVSDTATSILTLVNVTEDHVGNYTCSVAYNDIPSVNSTSEPATLMGISPLHIICRIISTFCYSTMHACLAMEMHACLAMEIDKA